MKFVLLILIVALAHDVGWSQRVENIPTSVTNIEVDSIQEHCNHLVGVGERLSYSIVPSDKRKGYDTLKAFIESCAALDKIDGYGPPRSAFSPISSDVADMDTINSRYLELRNWGMKVLYLSQDTLYYCTDVDMISGTLGHYLANGGSGRGIDVNAIVAVIDYLLNENRCPFETQSLLDSRVYIRNNQVTYWRDSVTDTLKTPLDTSAISIDSIGFSILRGPQFGAVRPSGIRNGFGLSELKANRNPFKDETTLQTHIEEATVLKLEIIDLLGKSLYSESKFFVGGDIHWVVNGKSLPEGSFYARLSTHEGDVRTIKLIKE